MTYTFPLNQYPPGYVPAEPVDRPKTVGIVIVPAEEVQRKAREFAERERAEREARKREQAEREAAALRPAEEEGAEPPLEVKADDPPQPVPVQAGREGDRTQCGGGDSPPEAAPEGQACEAAPEGESPPSTAAPLPPPRAGEDLAPTTSAEDAEEAARLRLVHDWLDEHWDTVEAMACAGEAPERPLPPAPPPPAHDGPPPYVAPEDRWTKWKMAEFLRHLAATQNITASAKAVKMSRKSAYKLRNRLKGQPFDIAWEAAFRHGYDNLAHSALELALEGEEVPHYHHGELVGTHRKRHPQLIMQLLRMRNAAGAPMLGRYGAAAEYWSEHWDEMTQRVEGGHVTWRDEQARLGAQERARLELPDAEKEIDRMIRRNLPDERGSGPGRG